MKHVYEIWLIYALLSQNFIVAIYALFPQIIWGWKVESADVYVFRMYAKVKGASSKVDECKYGNPCEI